MLTICTINAGNYLGRGVEYTNILHDSVRRNLAEGFEGEFVVFTDDTTEAYAPGIVVRPLPVDGLEGWFNKLALFKAGVFNDGDQVLFFDLDTVITGRLDELAAYDGSVAILRDFYRPDGLQSSVMAWTTDNAFTESIWDEYEAHGRPDFSAGGDQAWIEHVFDMYEFIPDILQALYPDTFVSYKADRLERNPPDRASVCVFHGLPRPHEVLTGWVPEVWKIGGLMRAELDLIVNVGNEAVERNVRASILRDLAWVAIEPPHDQQVAMVGGGPSLRDCLPELRWRASRGQQVWAINGAGRFLRSNGIEPDAIVIADARPDNAEFILDGVTIYLASQCDPAVFDATGTGYVNKPILWHVNSPGMAELLAGETERPVHLIGGGSTCGLNAMVLAYVLGYRSIHLYGYDSSYADSHHAYPQPLNDADRVLDVLFDGHKFKAAGWMSQQANEFQETATMLANEGCTVTVAGTGLIPTIARYMQSHPLVTPAQVRAGEVLSRLGGNFLRIYAAEVGVFAGEMSAALLEGCSELFLSMIDSWEGSGAAYEGDSGDWHAGLSQEAQDRYAAFAEQRTAFAANRRCVVKSRSTHAAAHYAANTLDFVFIDADHSYEGCKADIEAWAPKVRSGGLLCGHDYENEQFPKFGVTRAVNEYVASTGLSLDLGENYTWFVRMP